MMSVLNKIYRSSILSYFGKVIIISTGIILILALFIPSFQAETPKKQIYTLNGNHLKYDDAEQVSVFLESIKSNNGYLLLGTSESTSKAGGNYYNWLNADSQLPFEFSYLAGAGRTAGKYLPLFYRHQKEIKNLKLIYFLNPIYWADALSQSKMTYWERYVNYKLIASIPDDDANREYFDQVFEPFQNKLNAGLRLQLLGEYFLRKIRKPLFMDLRFLLKPQKFYDAFQYVDEIINTQELNLNASKVDTAVLNFEFNVNKDYMHILNKNHFERANPYRFQELRSFIHLCKEWEVDLCIVLGPYNELYFKERQADLYPQFVHKIQEIKDSLISYNACFIDASDLGQTSGTFMDNMHFSLHGAWLIYNKIKEYVIEKEDL